MKCIESIKSTKNVEVGTIKRVNDKDADSEVKSGYWKFVPKSEYKLATRKTKTVNEPVREKTPVNTEESKEIKDSKKKNKK